jgi:hypothetical protein
LEAVLVPRRVRLAEAGWETAGTGLVLLVGFGLYLWWSDIGVDTLAWIWVGGVALAFLWRYAVSDVPPPLVAGSDWVGTAFGRGSRVVPLYKLTRIDAVADVDSEGEPVPGTTALNLEAGDPRYSLNVDLALLQANPALWDLVYHGITQSLAAGAEITQEARDALCS